MRRLSKGQGTLEYVIILAAVVAAIIVVATQLQPRIRRSYNVLGTAMEAKVGEVKM